MSYLISHFLQIGIMSETSPILTPSKTFIKDVISKLPSTTSIKKQPDSKPLKPVPVESKASKLVKRKRLSSSSSCHSSPGQRWKQDFAFAVNCKLLSRSIPKIGSKLDSKVRLGLNLTPLLKN